MSTQKLASLLVRHEGLKLKPYRCPAGKLTIGVGRNIEDRGITKHEAMMMLDTDMALSNEDLLAVIGYETMSRLNEPRHAVLVSMVFNIGKTRFSRFKKMIAAVQASDWMRVSLEMQNSLWAKQVGQRAVDLCWMMRNGRWMDQEESAA